MTENNEVVVDAIPLSANQFQLLEDMEANDISLNDDESGWKRPPDWNDDENKDSWQNSNPS